MICLTKLNGKEFYLNPDLIEFLEETPDTVITLTTDIKILVKEPAIEVVDRIVAFKARVGILLPTVVSKRDEG